MWTDGKPKAHSNDHVTRLCSPDCFGRYVHGSPDRGVRRMLRLLHAAAATLHHLYQRQIVPPQYRAVQETVMVAPGGVVAHRTPAQYRTVMVPQTVMVTPAREYYVATPPRCSSCGY